MAQIASEDYANLLIYLHIDTVTQGVDFAELQREHRALRRINANDERDYDPMVSYQGNQAKGGGKFTAGQTLFRAGVRYVPYDVSHNLDILNEVISIDDGLADRDLADRTSLVNDVNIDPIYSPVEIRTVSVGSGVTAQDKLDISAGVWAEVLEGMSAEAMLKIMLSALAGNRSAISSTVEQYLAQDGIKPRITFTHDGDGNGTTVVDGT